ncbi:MAG: KTSC domain-containing protein [Methanobrevibacter arboriphilus]|nr:KTSC domain-containing protein [Methanobrevibacter arboriphilus]
MQQFLYTTFIKNYNHSETIKAGGENISKPKYEINSPIIHKIGFDPIKKVLSIQFTSGAVHKFNSNIGEYRKFLNSKYHDDYYYEKFHDKLKKTNSKK